MESNNHDVELFPFSLFPFQPSLPPHLDGLGRLGSAAGLVLEVQLEVLILEPRESLVAHTSQATLSTNQHLQGKGWG